MSKQLTLTGFVVHETRNCIYSKITSNYEHRYYRRNLKSKKSQKIIVEEAQQEWNKIKSNPASIEAFLSLKPGEEPISYHVDAAPSIQLRDFGFHHHSQDVVDTHGGGMVDTHVAVSM